MPDNMSKEDLDFLRKLRGSIEGPPEATTKRDAKYIEYSKDSQKIQLPQGMKIRAAINELKKIEEEQETDCNLLQEYKEYYYKDVLHAMKVTTLEVFGWIPSETNPRNRPTYINILTDIRDGERFYENCFYGTILASSWEDARISTSIDPYSGVASIRIQTKQLYKEQANDFLEKVENTLRTQSIYKGKSIVVTSATEYGRFDFNIVELKTNNNMVYNPKETRSIQRDVIFPLNRGQKRVILFTGSYGNGKTEAIQSIGRQGLLNGQTFFYVKENHLFTSLLKVANNYGDNPIVYLEDIDEIASGNLRDSRMNDILNTVDGTELKGSGIQILLTTNHPEKLSGPFRRFGRIDVIINITSPTKETAIAIIKGYVESNNTAPLTLGANNSSSNIDWKKVQEALPNTSGAAYAEMGKRIRSWVESGETLSTELVLEGIESTLDQIELMGKPIPKDKSLKGALKILLSEARQKEYWNDDDDEEDDE